MDARPDVEVGGVYEAAKSGSFEVRTRPQFHVPHALTAARELSDCRTLEAHPNAEYSDTIDGLIRRDIRDDQHRVLSQGKSPGSALGDRIGIVYIRPGHAAP
ncbi:MAG: hypothetical protein ABSF94_00930 [Steroidobacteraceae bacterium]